MKHYLKSAVLFGLAFLVSACSSGRADRSLYYWGDYSDVVYDYYEENGDYAKQEEALQQIIAAAQERGKPIAPGVYGHLGLVRLKQGKHAQAHDAFNQEQKLYPESTVFIRFLQKKK